jgi:ADP-ribose pyrophosphatase
MMSPGSPSGDELPSWRMMRESRSKGPSGYLRIVTRQYELPDGRISGWDLVDGGKTVAVFALTPNGEVILVRQFRPGPNQILNEMPGGYVEPDESPLEAARRELKEETGYEGEVEILAKIWLSASATTQRFVAVARNCRRLGEPAQLDDEFCLAVIVTLEDFRQQLRRGDLTDTDLGYLALDHLRLI